MTGATGGSSMGDRLSVAARGALVAIALALLAGCATPPPADDKEAVAEYQRINDPIEPLNRAVFGFNQGLDKLIIKPVTAAYRAALPDGLRRSIHNFLANLRSPVIFFNDVMQGNFDRAGTTASRFLINSTVGLLGFSDAAAGLGLEPHREDFGQTLAVGGIGEGPYLVLPVFGPSNPRDAVGIVVDFLIDPLYWWAVNTDHRGLLLARSGMNGIDTRDQLWDVLEDLEKSSIDYYAAIRSLYRQRRKDEINNGAAPDSDPAPGFSGSFELAGPAIKK